MQSAATVLRIERANKAFHKGLAKLENDLSPTNPVHCVTKVLRAFLLSTKDPYMWKGVHEVKLDKKSPTS